MRKKSAREVTDLDSNGKPLKKKFGGRGWLCERMAVENQIRARWMPFLTSNVASINANTRGLVERFKDLPKYLYWPDINDDKGILSLIDAVMDRDLERLIELQSSRPEFNLGIAEFIRFLANGGVRGTSQRAMLTTRKLPVGHTLDTELVKLDDGSIVIRAAIRHLGRTIATKILARKNHSLQPA